MIILAARRSGVERLTAAGVPDAAQDVAMLLAHVLGVSRADLALMSPQTLLSCAQVAGFEVAISARAARQPLSHITGQRLFWGRSFIVTPDVLDPRPETETLIAAALAHPFASVLDLGTGSGCILLSLLADRTAARGLGVDISAPALAVAARNQARLGVSALWAQGSWFDPVQGRFDLIVSNPPYIAVDEMAALSPEVQGWEPHLALTPGGDGLAPYRIISATAPKHLTATGRLVVEIGPSQGAAVAALFRAAGFKRVEILLDLDGRGRVVSGQLGEVV
ncbi:peptide chain release factor N(5)-glutamine methyltransferase (plasmid) [Pseudorhodobacter turbinis]|uniref:Release factor glutamine methyltransferase n=1 Tax=Pseudorhodobacter turbinis TaxID=2500533 RepID=A0A4P8EIF8_9RHOB|nr:peptide chain release factor N(5)-glutamine methyltransferase [Pseudorhodobacter turbinis]QCO56709.1 peptide chain release factor N(5)-glutamine methyltransferase [Pseudorhodobacter turbinis]